MPRKPPTHKPYGNTARQQQRQYDQRRPSRRKRGLYDRTWMKLRLIFLQEHPLCCECGRPAGEVDHKIPISERPELRLDPANLQAMCKSCHSRKTASEDGGFKGRSRVKS